MSGVPYDMETRKKIRSQYGLIKYINENSLGISIDLEHPQGYR
jgi:hypothetical protein